MRTFYSLLATISLHLVFGSAVVQAQIAFSSSKAHAPTGSWTTTPAAAEPGEQMVLTGIITNKDGALPGAVVILKATKQMAVTNASGEFQLVVPANAGPLKALVTYAGYADEEMTLNAGNEASTISLTHTKVIVVARRQRLKRYIKTAHKQVKHELRKLR